MTNKSRSLEELVGGKKDEKNLSPTHPRPDEPKEAVKEKETPVVVKGNVKVEGDNEIREDRVENFDNTGNEVTDNLPLDWEKAPAGTAIASGAVPSENAVVVNEVPVAIYAGENEYDDKGLKEEEEPPPDLEEPPVDETETPARYSSGSKPSGTKPTSDTHNR